MSQSIKKTWWIPAYITSVSYGNGKQIIGSTLHRIRIPQEILISEPNLDHLTIQEARCKALNFLKTLHEKYPHYIGIEVALIGGLQESFSVSYKDCV